MTGFLFGAGTGDTATSLKRKRELVASLKAQIMGETPKTVAQGVAALLKGAVAGIGQYQLNKQEDAGQKDVAGRLDSLRNNFYSQLVGDSASFPAPEAAGQVSATSPVNSSQPAPVNISGDKAGFVSSLLPAAQEAAARTGVDPRIIVAQAALESGWGKSAPGNNLFGIKSHGQSGGNSLMTSEVVDGKTVRQRDNFRAYGSPAESVNGYADFITENPRYKGMRSAKGLDAQIDELGRSGYATDPEYASKIRSIAQGIELPAEVASVDPQAAFGAVLADPSQIAPEDAKRLQAMRGPMGGNTPYSGPGAKIGTAMPVYDTNGLHMPQQGGSLTDEVAQFQQSPEHAAQFPGRQPQQAMPQPVQQQPMQQPAQQQAQAQPQPMPQAVQPQQQQFAQNGPHQSAQGDAAAMQQIFQMMSSPFVSPEQKQELNFMLEQLTSQQQQSREQQQWMQRQAYERQQQQSDPMYQQKLQAGQLEMEEARSGTWSRLDDGRLYNQRTGEFKEAPAPANGGMPSDLGLNPQYGTDAEGNPVLLQLGKNGQVVQSKMPEGVQLSKEPIKLDAGTHFVLLDPITRQPVGQIPKNVAGEASQTVEGKALGEARANLGQVEDTGNQVLSTIDSLVNDPYLDNMVGSVQGRLPNFSSDAARVQSKMDQIQGQAFLQAFNTLRGGGQITEIEGKKATDAIAALGTAQDEKDYRQALSNLRGVVATGLDRARQKAGSASPGDASPANADPLAAARDAIAKGAPRDAVIRRLQQSGINSEGL